MLIAGASSTPAMGGALTFAVSDRPSDVWQTLGSAYIFDMLLAGASVNSASACGALAFCADVPPSYALWVAGSAY